MTVARFLAPAGALAAREVVRFFRQRSRIIGALGTPLLFWLVIGSGLGNSFRPPAAADPPNYLTYFFPGAALLVVLFTAIFSCISIIEDRQRGFMQGVLVAPVHRAAIVAGKVLGSTALALAQGGLFLLVAPLAGIALSASCVLEALAVMAVAAAGLSAAGFAFAWRLDSIQGFHAIMNLVLMPMWFLSGALFPISGARPWIAAIMHANPLYYALAAMRYALHDDASVTVGGLPGPLTCWLVLAASAVTAFGVAARAVSSSTRIFS